MITYRFYGSVLIFGRFVGFYSAETTATSKAKAISNLKYRFRKENNIAYNTPISFDGDFTIIKQPF